MRTLLLFDGDDATEVTEVTVDTVDTVDTVGDTATLDAAAVLQSTGWELKPYGLCRGEVCNPARLGDTVTLTELAEALHRPLALEIDGDTTIAVLGAPGGAAAIVGDVPAELTLPDVDGNPVHIAGAGTGRKTAVVTWSTWCGCRYELPSWLELADELRPLGLDLVTVALDDDVDAVRKWTSRVAELPTAVDAERAVDRLAR